MLSNVCVTCRKVFSRRSNLVRHINNRQTSCQPTTHHCDRCHKGLSSYQTLWEHRQKCLSSPEERHPTKVISDSTVLSGPLVNTSSDQRSPLKVIPYILSSKDSIPPTRNQIEMFTQSQKKVTTLSKVNDNSVPSDEEDENEDGAVTKHFFSSLDEDDGDIKRLFTQLDILSNFIGAGYIRLGPAIVDTVDELRKLDAITEEQYHRLTDVFQQFV